MNENPPWATRVLNENWSALEAAASRLKLPMPLHERVGAHRRTTSRVPTHELGCAHYGCVWQTEKSGTVIKLTSDPTEAHFVAAALTLREKGVNPEGIVRYDAIFALPSGHRGRPTFVLWREEAKKVGLTITDGDQYERRVSAEFLSLLSRFKYPAHEAMLLADSQLKKLSSMYEQLAEARASYERDKEWMPDYMKRPAEKRIKKLEKRVQFFGLGEKHGLGGGGDPRAAYWKWMAGQLTEEQLEKAYGEFQRALDAWQSKDRYARPELHVWITGWHKEWHNPNRFAYLVEACHQSAMELENNASGYLVGAALLEYLEAGLLLADVHGNNVGTVSRDEYASDIWAITDPGHAVVLNESLSRIEVPRL